MSLAPLIGLSTLLDARWPLVALGIMSVVVIALVFTAGVLRVRSGTPSTRLFLAGTSLLALTVCVANPLVTGLLGISPAAAVMAKVGIALHFIFYSGALADRISAMNIERILLVEMATIDEKTGLNNFRFFDSTLRQEVKRALRYRRPLSLLMIDVDDFKRINDEYGHRAGDEALLAVGGVLRAKSRDVDIVARYGGDEFAVVLPETTLVAGIEAAEKLRRAMEEVSLKHGDAPLQITISIGVASLPVHARERDGLIEAADKALYVAKESGKNQVRVPPAAAMPQGERS
jgi:diguanylate cyclase (GGDEF)-like protein